MMTTIATCIAILMYVWALFHANRASNLEVQRANLERQRDTLLAHNAQLRARHCDLTHTELRYKLDDATRELDQLRYTNGRLIAENTTLCLDLVRTEEEATRYRSHYQARKGLIAGWHMTNGLCEPTRNMTVFSLEQVP